MDKATAHSVMDQVVARFQGTPAECSTVLIALATLKGELPVDPPAPLVLPDPQAVPKALKAAARGPRRSTVPRAKGVKKAAQTRRTRS